MPTELAELLVDIHIAVEVARSNGATMLPADRLADYWRRYDALVAAGKG